MSGDTLLTKSEVDRLVNGHETTLNDITTEKGRIAETVAATAGANKGAIFDALVKAHEVWDTNLREIQKQFEAMTKQVKNTSQSFGTTDEEGASAITKAGNFSPGEMSHLS
ncbi:hypothetical protein [Saccharopolyspora gloriosae]|uniref:hypothetical protein n=1 Tax=Saccharopolyspora gloriosae TaxID=455344 RepID=UPI001FB5E54C|nr:hypothetical protein [Saccharopolyspora gloriosae]